MNLMLLFFIRNRLTLVGGLSVYAVSVLLSVPVPAHTLLPEKKPDASSQEQIPVAPSTVRQPNNRLEGAGYV
jgi:hypothetical protein